MSKPDRATGRRFGLRWWALRVAAALLVALLVAVAGGYYFWTGRPAGWEQAQTALRAMPAASQRSAAQSLANQTVTQMTDLRDAEPWQLRIGLEEANAWLAHELRPWAVGQGQPIPQQVGHVAVWTEAGRVVFGAEADLDGTKQVISIAAAHEVNEQGQVVVKLAGVRAGRVPLPVNALVERLDLASNPRTAPLLPYIDMALTGVVLEPQPIDNTRRVRVEKVDVEEDAVVLTLRTEPRAATD